MCYVFFFFKQKTAYEMRISDWSSDVCSSDLARLLKPLAADYDLVLLDGPPSVSLVSEAVFHAADALAVPLIPTTLSLRTYDQLVAFRDAEGLGDLVLLPFFSMVDRRKRLHREIVDRFPDDRPEALAAGIPYASVVERMGTERAPLATFAPRATATRSEEHTSELLSLMRTSYAVFCLEKKKIHI